jgi:predicted nucleotidyltransferase/biotin operon repressor
MDFSQPFRVVTPTLDGPVLRVLARTTQPMTRQQVADLVGEASEAGVRKVLRRLAEQGVVIEQRIGTHYSYVGNRERILWPAVEVFMSAADRLDTTIREHVVAWEVPALSVELFGSVASVAAGTSTADSDIDLMVYRPSLTDDQVELWDGQVAELRMAVERWTGNACEVLEIDPRTLVKMAAEDEPVLKAPRVPISGLNIAAAAPSMEIAKSIQKAMASSDVNRFLASIDSKQLFDVAISPAVQRTIMELGKQADEIVRVATSPAMVEAIRRQRS